MYPLANNGKRPYEIGPHGEKRQFVGARRTGMAQYRIVLDTDDMCVRYSHTVKTHFRGE